MPRKEYRKITKDYHEVIKKNYKDAVDAINNNGLQKLYNRYGSNGKMFDTFGTKDKYDKIKINIPKGLNEDFVTAIVMGSMLRKDRLDKRVMTSSSMGAASPLDFNRTMITQNFVNSDVRQGEFLDLLPKARQEAKEALEEYEQGKPEKAMQMLNDFLDSRMDSARQMSIRSSGAAHDTVEPETMTILLAAKVVGQPPLNARGTYPEHEVIRLQNFQKMFEARNKVNELQYTMYNDPPAANSPERKKMVEDILFYKLVEHISYTEIGYNESIRSENLLDRMYENLGIEVLDGQDPEYDDTIKSKLETNPRLKDEKNKLSAAYNEHHISDQQMILAKPNGLEELRNCYINAIRKSDRYKDLVEAQGDEIYEALDDISTFKYDKEFPDVKVPEAAKEYNKSQEAAYNKKLKEIEKNVTQIVIDSKLLDKEDEKDYCIQSFSKEDLKKNAKIMSDMYKTLTDNDVWYKRSSTQFKNLKREMKNLKEMAEKMAKNGTEPTLQELSDYEKKAREVNSLTEEYLDYKKVANGDYAQRRLKSVQNIRRHLGTNLRSIVNTYDRLENQKIQQLQDDMNAEFKKNIEMSKLQEEFNKNKSARDALDHFSERIERLNKYDIKNGKNIDMFLGDKHTREEVKENVPAGYTIWRTGGYSITIMAMAAEGKYTMDQLLDPDQCQKEKQEMFDKVFTRMKEKTDENQKWIAKQIYEGQKAAFNMIDECCKDIDFNNTNYLLNVNENKMEAMNSIIFDSWQEMSHCQKEIVELANKENPKIKEYKDLKEDVATRIGPLAGSVSLISKALRQVTGIVEGKLSPENYAGPVILQLIQGKINVLGMDELALKDKDGNLLPYTQRFTLKTGEKLEMDGMLATLDPGISKFSAQFKNDPKAFFEVLPKLLDDSAFKDIRIVRDPKNPDPYKSMRIEGIPSKEQLLSEIKYEKMAKDEPNKLDFMKNSAIIKYDEAAAKASPVHKSFIEKAKNAVTTLHDMIKSGTKLIGEKREIAKNCLKDIMSEKLVGVMEKSGTKLNAGSEKEINKTIEKLPAFQKATDFIGMGDLGEFAFEGKANQLVKESVAEIQKNQAEAPKAAQEQKALEHQADMQIKQGEQPDKKNPEDPKIKAPNSGDNIISI